MKTVQPILFFVAMLSLMGIQHAAAQLPVARLTSIAPAGGQQGAQVEVKLTGNDLDDVARIIFSHPGIEASPKLAQVDGLDLSAEPLPGEFIIKIAGDVPPGMYEARVLGRFGMSNPRAFVVGTLEEVSAASNHRSRDSAMEVKTNTTINSRIDGEQIDYYTFEASGGQRMLVDCMAERIDSKLDATLVLFDPVGREISRVRDSIGRDPVIDFTAPESGRYVLGVYDFVHAGGAEYYYRLTISDRPHVDFIFPPAGIAGSSSKFTLYGRNLPEGKPADGVMLHGLPLEKQEVTISLPAEEAAAGGLQVKALLAPSAASLDGFPYSLDSPAGPSNVRMVYDAAAPIVIEAESNGEPDGAVQLSIPCDFAGQLYPHGDEDWVSFEAARGERISIEVFADRLGNGADPVLRIEKVIKSDGGEPQVKTIAEIDDVKPAGSNATSAPFDMRSNDPSYLLNADEDAVYRVGVRDLYGAAPGDPRIVYRLVIRKSPLDFRLVVSPELAPGQDPNKSFVAPAAVRRGDSVVLRVRAFRQGFDGDILVTAENLPPGVTCHDVTLSPGVNTGPLVLAAAEDAAGWAGTIRIVGRAKIDGADVQRVARTGSIVWGTPGQANDPFVSRLTQDVGFSVIDKELAPATAVIGNGQVIEACLGSNLQLPIRVTRRGEFKGEIRVRPRGLPAGLKPNEIKVGGEEGKYELALNNKDLRGGIYTLYFVSRGKTRYARNPDAIAAAETRLAEVDKLVADMKEQTKNATEEEAEPLAARLRQAEELQKQRAARVNEEKKRNEPKDVDFAAISPPVVLNVATSPIVLAPPGELQIAQGGSVELPVSITRKFDFADRVELSLQFPPGCAGVEMKPIEIKAGESSATSTFHAGPQATPGRHECTLRAKLRMNNLDLETTQTIIATITAVEGAQ